MRLNELNEGDKISLEVIFSGENYEFSTSVMGKIQDFILSDTVKSEDKVVGFNGVDIRLNLIFYRKDKLPIVWKGIGCTLVEYKGKMLYKIVASGEGFELNRRKAFRLYMGTEAVVQIGMNSKALDVTLKDISESGFAFVTEQDVEDAEDSIVRAVFSDGKKSMTLMGKIVRKVNLDEAKILYGCKLNIPSQGLSHYINEVQRIRLAAGRNLATGTKELPDNVVDKTKVPSARERRIEDEKANLKSSRRNSITTSNQIGHLDREERRKIFWGNKQKPK